MISMFVHGNYNETHLTIPRVVFLFLTVRFYVFHQLDKY